jgi:hypothetical protein
MSNGRRVPPNGSPTPPRGPRPAGFYDRGTEYDHTPGGPRADGRTRGQADRASRAGQPGPQYYGPAGDQYGQTAPGQDYGRAPAAGWPRPGHDQHGGTAGPYGPGQPRADQYRPQQPGPSTGRPGPGPHGQATSEPRQPRYGAEYPSAGPGPFRSTGYGPPGYGPPGYGPADQPGQGQYGQTQYGQTQYGPGQYGPDPRAAGEFGPRNTGSWQAAGPAAGPTWAGGQGQYAQQDPRNTGSWQAAGQDQAWAAGPGQYGPDPRSTGSWQAAGPEYGQGWAAGQGQYARDPRNTGSWQAAGQQQGPGWAGQEQFGSEFRNTGSWQAAGQTPGQSWAGPGQPPFHDQPYPGHPYPGQAAQGGRLGDPLYSAPPQGAGPGMRTTGSFARAGSPVIRQRDSALPDPPQGSKGVIAAIETDNIAAFARDLRVLRAKAGLDYPDMAEKSHYTMRTLASAAGGLRLPTLPVLIAYVNACGGDVAEWEERWDRLMKSGKKGSIALPAAGRDGGEPGVAQGGRSQIPPEARRTGEIYVITSAKDRDDRW